MDPKHGPSKTPEAPLPTQRLASQVIKSVVDNSDDRYFTELENESTGYAKELLEMTSLSREDPRQGGAMVGGLHSTEIEQKSALKAPTRCDSPGSFYHLIASRQCWAPVEFGVEAKFESKRK